MLISRARQLDPMSASTSAQFARVLYFGRRYAEAIEQCNQAVHLDPFFQLSYYHLGFALEMQGQLNVGLKAFERAVQLAEDDPAMLSAYGYGLARTGAKSEALTVLKQLDCISRKQYVSPVHVATLQVGLANLDAAFKALEEALEVQCPRLIHVAVDPVFDPLKTDPRLAKLLRSLALDPSHVVPGAH